MSVSGRYSGKGNPIPEPTLLGTRRVIRQQVNSGAVNQQDAHTNASRGPRPILFMPGAAAYHSRPLSSVCMLTRRGPHLHLWLHAVLRTRGCPWLLIYCTVMCTPFLDEVPELPAHSACYPSRVQTKNPHVTDNTGVHEFAHARKAGHTARQQGGQ